MRGMGITPPTHHNVVYASGPLSTENRLQLEEKKTEKKDEP